jgi:hypothetical protein
VKALGPRCTVLGLLAIEMACGGKSATPDAGWSGAGQSGQAGTGGGGQGGGQVLAHRPVAVACAASEATITGSMCSTDTDCQPEGGVVARRFCLGGRCSMDQCLTDDDCPAGQACGCASQIIGLTNHLNSCLPSSCRIDADCATGLCSPANGGHCGSLSGYHCRKASDTCQTIGDCPRAFSAVAPYGFYCGYAPEVDRWQCVTVTVCGG